MGSWQKHTVCIANVELEFRVQSVRTLAQLDTHFLGDSASLSRDLREQFNESSGWNPHSVNPRMEAKLTLFV